MQEVFLNQFQIIKPPNKVTQIDLLEWIIKCHQYAEKNNKDSKLDLELIEKLFNRYSVKASQISQRFFECDDILLNDFSSGQIYKMNSENKNGVDLYQRTLFFSERADNVFKQVYNFNENFKRPNHLIHVTCTGYISPSAVQKIIVNENWKSNTSITHAYHMGCYASMPSIRMARSFVASESITQNDFSVDLVHTEMCGLHMNPLAHTPEQMVVQTLFADGHAKYTASNQLNGLGTNLKILAIHEKVITESTQDMSWIPSGWGMQMNLSREVPAKIKSVLKEFSNELFAIAKISEEVALKSIFAIHPGGPKIIDSVQEVLNLNDSQITESKKILFEHGNMSSATLPHVWNEILNKKYQVGTKVVSFAFGPGLTLFGSVFEVC